MESATRRPLVLVPGACLGGWAWREVAHDLRARGHEVYPVTLTGLGERAHLGSPAVDLETHIEDVLGVLDYEALEDAVLVGHSYAGIVVTAVADRRPERLNAVVYFDSSAMPDGVALADVQPPQMRETQRREVEQRGEGWLWPAPDRETLETGAFGSAAGLSEEHFRLIEERGTPHPYKTFTSRLRLRHEVPPGVRRVVIFCTAGGLTIELVRELVERKDPRAMLFAAPDWELHELPTGHWAMFSAPASSAELLSQIAGQPMG
jgi:pimeloyl-ACP methyl ester carboxylesterase